MSGAIEWILDPANWGGSSGIGIRLLEHIVLTGAIVGVAALIGIPIGVLAGHFRDTKRGQRIGGAIVTTVAAGRAIPTLGILTLVALAVGIGLVAPFIALVMLALPSVLAGAYAGVSSVDPTVTSAARSIGLTPRQVMWRVEIPIALPTLVGGLRGASLQVVSTATIAAYVADAGLGRFIFAALAVNDTAKMLGASILVIILAVMLDLMWAAIQGIVTPASHKLMTPAAIERTQT